MKARACRTYEPSRDPSAVRLESLRDFTEVALAHEAAPLGLTKKTTCETIAGTVVESPERRRYGDGPEPRALRVGHVVMIEHDSFRHAESTRSPRARDGEVDLRGQDVGELVQRERRLMREHAGPARPEPYLDEVFMLARREVRDAENTSTKWMHTSDLDVMEEQRSRVAGFRGLRGREEACLRRGGFEEAVPVGPGRGHARQLRDT